MNQSLSRVFLWLTRPDARQHSCFRACGQARGLKHKNKFLSLSVFVGPSGIDRIVLCWRSGGSSITILPILISIIRTIANCLSIVQCVQVNTSQYLNTFDFVSTLRWKIPGTSSNSHTTVPVLPLQRGPAASFEGPAASANAVDEKSAYSDEYNAQSQDSGRIMLYPDLYILTKDEHWAMTPNINAAATGSFCFVTTENGR